MTDLPLDDDRAWAHWRRQWPLREDTIYLNHGSFGPSPRPVREAQRQWLDRLESQPMDFFVRQLKPELLSARERLGGFIGTSADNLVFVSNATHAMNVVADSFPLAATDEVLLTDHEYGAVERIWQRACRRAGAPPPHRVRLPLPIESSEQVIDAIMAAATPRTRLLVVSHITSVTAVTLPVAEICRAARARNIAVCIDGPHAVAQLPLSLDTLGCDYYTASCHKWLCAPFGAGFLYATPPRHDSIEPAILSWGAWEPDEEGTWHDEFTWMGTYDPSPALCVPTAIDFLRDVGLDAFRRRTHYLARYAGGRLAELTGLVPITPDDPRWYTSMAQAPLPCGEARPLQQALWEQHGIEVPIIAWNDARWIRVSCHLYNTKEHIDRLIEALARLLRE